MRQFVLVSALLGTLLLSLTSCDSDGLIGSSIIDDPSEIISDTVLIKEVTNRDIPSFSGGRSNMTAGWYNDELFGELKFTAIMQPTINRTNVDTISEQATAVLRFEVNSFYGDQQAPLQLNIVELDRRWRTSSWRIDSIPPVSDRVLGNVTVTGENVVEAEIDANWLQEYRSYYYNTGASRDSLYRNSFFGLALVPENESKLISFSPGSTRLVIDNHLDADTTYAQNMRSWGYSKEHIEPETPYAEDAIPVFNNFKNNYFFSFNIHDEFENIGDISRAELVIFQDTLSMASTLPAGHERPASQVLNIYLLREAQASIAVTGQENFAAPRRASDGSWRFNITSYVRSQIGEESDDRNFYIKVGRDDGTFQPYYIHNHLSDTRRPKILITRINASGI